jgi:hypothetical protein
MFPSGSMSDIPSSQPTGAGSGAEPSLVPSAENAAGTPPVHDEAAAPPAVEQPAEAPATGNTDSPTPSAETGVISGAGPGTSAGPIPGLFPPATGGAAPEQEIDTPATDAGAGGGGDAAGGGAEPPKQRDAIIVVPGLAASPGVSLEDVARRMAMAMDNEAGAGATFEVTKGQEEAYGKRGTRTVTITRKDGAVETPVVDLYEFDYRGTLTSSMTDKKPIQQLAYMAQASLISSWRLAKPLFRAFRKDGKSKPLAHQVQVMYGLMIFMTMFAYIVMLALVLGGSVAELATKRRSSPVAQTTPAAEVQKDAPATAPATVPKQTQATTGQPAGTGSAAAPGQQKSGTTAAAARGTRAPRTPWWMRWINWAQTGIIGFTLFGFFVRFNLKAALEKSAPTLACTTEYLGIGARRKAMVGELSRLINYLDEKKKDGFTYRNVYLMGYSFGSIVAIDALFPQEAAPNRRQQRIHTLITIGCPFDFVRTYWSDYFNARYGSEKPPRWINVYTEADVLGSNFLDEDGEKGIPAGVMVDGSDQPRRPADGDNVPFGSRMPLHQYPVAEQIYFAGFRVHAQYWDRDTDEGVTCFEPIVRRLYAGDPVLA